MKLHRARKERLFVMDGPYAVEDRVLMSTIGRSIPAPSAHVLVATSNDRAVVHARPIQARSTIHAAGHHSRTPAGPAAFPTSKRWSWLADTYWYVPTANLPAILYNASSGQSTLVSDQTVFHIEGYSKGYFWGKAVTQLGSTSASTSSMLGSVTPEGQVLLTFTLTSTNSSPSVTQGFGKMTKRFGQWTMENQMFTSPTEKLQIGHWAYMVQTRPGMPSWVSLPAVGESVPTFLSQ
ncbi:MAG: hypothetical protein P4L85_29285 [Paludisphaera borealis]|uniref:hypothetical protein n=1 Tax=Paludisphaera borealis TaxID=1387353 RepID=UPI002843C079|nr:hypothetical protein [Paludisphaera borealis]MDR3623462.1 hypothetical protein [Paludisphaera borealis]